MRVSIASGALMVFAVALAAIGLHAAPPVVSTERTATAPVEAAPDGPAVVLPDVPADRTKAFRPVRRPVCLEGELCGHVDWSSRTIVAVGEAPQQGQGSQAALKARRAAGVVALRNAMALAAGLRIGPNGQIKQLPRGSVILEGYLKDFEITRTTSRQVGGRTVWTAEAHVPMFGIEHVAGRLYEPQARAYDELETKLKRGQWAAPAEGGDAAGDVLIIDARGTELTPSMYPLVRSADGRILIDMQTAEKSVAVARGPVAFATTGVKFERLASSGKAASESTAEPSRHPEIHTLRAARAEGPDKTVLVMADDDAGTLLKDRAVAAAVRQGRVIILIEGEPAAAKP